MDRSQIRTFNSAKKFAEEVLHPLMIAHKDSKLKTRLGAISDEEATLMNPKVRTIKRFNAMKERIVILQTLLTEVEPTVRLNGRKSEIGLIEELSNQLSSIEDSYDERTDELIEIPLINNGIPILTSLFKQMGQYLDKIYVQLQRLMTKNKLLFYGEDNDFADDAALLERIKTENRSA